MEYGRNRATVVLEDGAVFEGWSFAARERSRARSSSPPAWSATRRPSYRGQIVLFTYPLIGNYGVIPGDDESRKVQAAGVLVREYTRIPATGRASASQPSSKSQA